MDAAEAARYPAEASALRRAQADGRGSWAEAWCATSGRPFFHDGATSTWDRPLRLAVAEWSVDGVFGVGPRAARDVLEAADALAAEPAAHAAAAPLMRTLLANASAPGAPDKHRSVRVENARFAKDVWAHPAARALLLAAGWERAGADRVVLPHAEAAVARCRCALARLDALQELESGETRAQAERDRFGSFYGGRAYACGACRRPICDGSERLWSRRWDAPEGEIRWTCSECADFHLCPECFDRRATGAAGVHDAAHAFDAVHPATSRHHMYSRGTDRNPWGGGGAGPVGRARDRLRERTGL